MGSVEGGFVNSNVLVSVPAALRGVVRCSGGSSAKGSGGSIFNQNTRVIIDSRVGMVQQKSQQLVSTEPEE